MATLTVVSYSATTVTLRADGFSPGDEVFIFGRIASDPSDGSIYDLFIADSTYVQRTYTGLLPSTTYLASLRVNGEWFYGTSDQFPDPPSWTTKATTDRPWSWDWYSTIVKGGNINLTAVEWNDFCLRVNEFRVYAGLGEYTFTTVSSGMKISAAICNEAWNAINGISGRGTMPSAAVKGAYITASFFTGLRDALNAVP